MSKALKSTKAKAKKLGIRVTTGKGKNAKPKSQQTLMKSIGRKSKAKKVKKKASRPIPKVNIHSSARALGSRGGKKTAKLPRNKKGRPIAKKKKR